MALDKLEPVVGLVAELETLGYRPQRDRSILMSRVGPGVSSWLSLNMNNRGDVDFLHLDPLVGVRVEDIEAVDAELAEVKLRTYVPATLSTPLYELLGRRDTWSLSLDDSEQVAAAMAEIRQGFEGPGAVWIDGHRTPEAVVDALLGEEGDMWFGPYRAAIGLALTGRQAEAADYLIRMEQGEFALNVPFAKSWIERFRARDWPASAG